MITITPSALEKINVLKSEENLGADYFMRVSVVGGGCSGLSSILISTTKKKRVTKFLIPKALKLFAT